jgi:hypothetical protein
LIVIDDKRSSDRLKFDKPISHQVHFDFADKSKRYVARLQDTPVYTNLSVLSLVAPADTKALRYIEKRVLKLGDAAM